MKRLVQIIIVAILVASCTQEIEIKLNKTTPELVVEGVVTNEAKAHTIYLKKTGDYFMNQPVEMISGAVVTLSDGFETVVLQEDSANKGAYRTAADYRGVAGKNYTLEIKNVDVDGDGVKETYSATCRLNPIAPVDSVAVDKLRMGRQDIYEIKVSMQDLPAVKDFYLFRVYRNGDCKSDSISEWGISDDEFFNGKYLKNETVMILRSGKPDERLVDGDDIKLEVCAINQDYMMFIYEVGEEFRGRNPLFGGQPANIRTNIVRTFPVALRDQGARGYFAAYSVGWGETIYREAK